MKVALFIPCLSEHLYPESALAMVKVLVLGAHGPQKLIVCMLADDLWAKIEAVQIW